jgi:hypothetical protein
MHMKLLSAYILPFVRHGQHWAVLWFVHRRYWIGVRLVAYKQLYSAYCCVLRAINITKEPFL